MTTKKSTIMGAVLAAAIGDAMGAPTETRPVKLVKEYFDGFVYDYKVPPEDSLAKGLPRGFVTDDFSLSYVSAQHFVKAGGKVTRQAAVDALLEWSEMEQWFIPYSGPTTKWKVLALKGGPRDTSRDYLLCENSTGTNGGGMKAWVVGLFDAGNVDKAIDDAIVMCLPTHENVVALSGACAVAAATAQAMVKGATVDQVIEAGCYGAREGLARAYKVGRPACGANIEKRIRLAVSIGLKYAHDFEQCIVEMTDIIGTGLQAVEAIPAAFGYLAACGGDVMKAIYLSVNSGNDSDTVAIMAAAMAGALYGADGIPEDHLPFLEEVNDLQIAKLIDDIDAITD